MLFNIYTSTIETCIQPKLQFGSYADDHYIKSSFDPAVILKQNGQQRHLILMTITWKQNVLDSNTVFAMQNLQPVLY